MDVSGRQVWTGTLRAFDAGTYRATVEVGGTWGYTVGGVPVSRGIAAAAMVTGRLVFVLVVDASDVGSNLVVGVF